MGSRAKLRHKNSKIFDFSFHFLRHKETASEGGDVFSWCCSIGRFTQKTALELPRDFSFETIFLWGVGATCFLSSVGSRPATDETCYVLRTWSWTFRGAPGRFRAPLALDTLWRHKQTSLSLSLTKMTCSSTTVIEQSPSWKNSEYHETLFGLLTNSIVFVGEI